MNIDVTARTSRVCADGYARLDSTALFTLDRHGCILTANTPAHDLWSAAGKTLCGVSFASLFNQNRSTLPGVRLETGWERLLVAALNHSATCVARPSNCPPFDALVRIEESHGEFPGYFATIESAAKAAKTQPLLVDSGLALLAEQGGVGFFDLNFKAGQVYYSPGWKRLLGYSDKELVNTYDSWLRLLHPDDSSAAPDHVARRQTVGIQSFSVEVRMLHRSGHYAWVHCLGTQVFGAGGELERVTGLQLEISERKELEEQSTTTEERFRRINDCGTLAAFDLNFGSKKYWLSPSWQTLAGLTDFEGPNALHAMVALLPPDQIVGDAQSFFLGFNPGESSFVASTVLHRDGAAALPVLLSAHRQLGRNRELVRVTGVCCLLPPVLPPVSNSLIPEPLLTGTLAAVHEALIVADAQRRIVFANGHAERLTGWDFASLQSSKIRDVFRLVRRSDGQPADDALEQAMSATDEVPFCSDHVLVPAREGNARRIVWSARQVWTADGGSAGYVITFRDPEEMSLSPEELLRGNRLETLGTVAGGIAHDFNNLLTTILGGISHAKDNRDQSYLGDSERACLAAKALTKQLLAAARGQSGEKMQNIGPSEIIREAARLARAGSAADVSIQVADAIAPVRIYRSQMLQVLQNLIVNAVQALPPRGGLIWLRATMTSLEEGAVPPLSSGQYVELSVKDNGSGIAPEYVDRIFEPFFTTKKQGTGLGLPTVLNLVRRHGGQIRVESTVGEGTTFRIFLPPAPQQAQPIEARKAPTLRFGTGRILFMDDDPDIGNIVGGMLASLDYRFDVARNGEEAIAFYKRYLKIGKPYDAVILDLTVIGGMGGEDTFKALRDLDSEVRTIMCSGYDSDELAGRYLDMGCCGYLTKPFRLGDLAQIVKTVLGPDGQSGA